MPESHSRSNAAKRNRDYAVWASRSFFIVPTVALVWCAAVAGAKAQSGNAASCAKPNADATVVRPVRPEYPTAAVAKDLDLRPVLVRVVIDASGKVAQATIYRSSGDSALDDAARKAARASGYEPKRIACQAVSATYLFAAYFVPDGYAPVSADLPQSGHWNNPFCDAAAVLLPTSLQANRPIPPTAATYVLDVWAKATSSFAARVSLVGDRAAYAVDVPKTQIPSSSAPFGHAAFLVTFPQDVAITAFFVDGVGIDGKPITDCPSYVKTLANAEESATPTGPRPSLPHLVPRVLEAALPADCPATYAPLQTAQYFAPVVGSFGDRSRTTEVQAFVDAGGNVVGTRIWHSSGVDGIDAAAIAAVQYSKYRPASFLCTPVVSSGIYSIDYQP